MIWPAPRFRCPKEKTADGKLDAYVGKTLKVGIRPEDIKDDEEFLEKHPNSHISAEVEVSELMGAEIYLYLTYQGQNLMARVAPTSKSRRGDKIVSLWIPTRSTCSIPRPRRPCSTNSSSIR